MISSTNQLFSSRNEWSKDLSRLKANITDMVWELCELFHAMNAREFLQTKSKPGRRNGRGRSSGLHVENKMGTKP